MISVIPNLAGTSLNLHVPNKKRGSMNNLSDEKINFINKFLDEPLIARLATADLNGQPHAVPVWYGWDGTSIWVSSFSNTRKIKDLYQNPRISIVIDKSEEGGETKAVIMEGKAELVVEPRDFLKKQFLWIYQRYLGEEGVKEQQPREWIEDSHNLLVKLNPEKVYMWSW
jgi:PPOX class probable F420-dependent enzyme